MSGASRTFVACAGEAVIGYYALASGGISPASAPGKFRRNMPDPIPIAILARLAVDRAWQRRGLGRALVRDCAERVAQAAGIIGIRGILVHALNEDARTFYLSVGFDPSPTDSMTLMITLNDIKALRDQP